MLDYAISSPYKRSRDTIQGCADAHGLEIHYDERLRERVSGPGANTHEMIRRRWENMNYHEEGGESLNMLQHRNMEALSELLKDHVNKNIIVGTHGSALSTILNYYYPAFGFESFFRIFDFKPYIIRLDFDGTKYIGQEEVLIVEKEFIAPAHK
jgi:2,3-bisphosphoglycerate-dependent phosphoglycerate mutase